jgi:transcriptional regulator GlxA family with amidase domain
MRWSRPLGFDRSHASHRGALTGSSPLQWLAHQRILRAQRLLEDTDLTIDAVARQVGLATAVTMRPAFRRVAGVSPQVYRANFRGPRR